ncbi:integrase [Porphyromonas gingivalis TDC60]|nr:integrase [Porphyromonas gingivalis TDC60]
MRESTGPVFTILQRIPPATNCSSFCNGSIQRTEVECLIPPSPIAEQILSFLPEGKRQRVNKIFPKTITKNQLIAHFKAIDLACGIRTSLGYHK